MGGSGFEHVRGERYIWIGMVTGGLNARAKRIGY